MRPVFREDHEQFREQARRFIEREIVPHLHAWEAEGIVPKSVWLKAGEAGLLCSTVPEAYGGAGGDFGHSAVMIEELARVNATAVGFTTHSEIVAPYIVAYGTEEQKQRWLPKMVSGEMIGVIAMSEPGVGSDLRSMRTTAARGNDTYIINGQKTFITNGGNADLAVTATKLDPAAKELTLICVETDRAGFSKGRRLEKIGLKGQDTSELFFDNVSVPMTNRLGEEGHGFKYLTHQLAWERTIIGIRAAASIDSLIDQTIQYTRDRKVFGKTVFDFQNTKFKLADIKAQAVAVRTLIDHYIGQHMARKLTLQEAAIAKLFATETMWKCMDEMVQLHGGYGYMLEYPIARSFVDMRVTRIFGGTSEVLRELIARKL